MQKRMPFLNWINTKKKKIFNKKWNPVKNKDGTPDQAIDGHQNFEMRQIDGG